MRGELTSKDKEEIENNKWGGRIWGYEKTKIEFSDQSESFGLTLTISFFKRNSK